MKIQNLIISDQNHNILAYITRHCDKISENFQQSLCQKFVGTINGHS